VTGQYRYDGNLRRVKVVSNGVTRYNVFDLSGRLVFVHTPASDEAELCCVY
jgi:hypothetical protein